MWQSSRMCFQVESTQSQNVSAHNPRLCKQRPSADQSPTLWRQWSLSLDILRPNFALLTGDQQVIACTCGHMGLNSKMCSPGLHTGPQNPGNWHHAVWRHAICNEITHSIWYSKVNTRHNMMCIRNSLRLQANKWLWLMGKGLIQCGRCEVHAMQL